jgi:hypothetical protein
VYLSDANAATERWLVRCSSSAGHKSRPIRKGKQARVHSKRPAAVVLSLQACLFRTLRSSKNPTTRQLCASDRLKWNCCLMFPKVSSRPVSQQTDGEKPLHASSFYLLSSLYMHSSTSYPDKGEPAQGRDPGRPNPGPSAARSPSREAFTPRRVIPPGADLTQAPTLHPALKCETA